MIGLSNSNFTKAQAFRDTLFFDSDWKACDPAVHSFYRIYEKAGSDYKIFDYFKDGKLQMTTSSTSPNPLNKNGVSVYYNTEGFRTLVANYKDNKPVGHSVWYYKNEKDSSVADYNADGTKNYTRICDCEPRGNVFTVVEQMPEYPGGTTAMMDFVRKNIKYPQQLREKNIGGKVFIKFVIDSAGNISNTEIIKSGGDPAFDNEATRVVRSMPKWTPGYQNKRAVSVYFNLPLNFSMSEPYYVFNSGNNGAAYLEAKEYIYSGKDKEVIKVLEKEASFGDNLDVLYNLGVAYYMIREKKEACERFSKITKLSVAKTTVVQNSLMFLEKYCN